MSFTLLATGRLFASGLLCCMDNGVNRADRPSQLPGNRPDAQTVGPKGHDLGGMLVEGVAVGPTGHPAPWQPPVRSLFDHESDSFQIRKQP